MLTPPLDAIVIIADRGKRRAGHGIFEGDSFEEGQAVRRALRARGIRISVACRGEYTRQIVGKQTLMYSGQLPSELAGPVVYTCQNTANGDFTTSYQHQSTVLHPATEACKGRV